MLTAYAVVRIVLDMFRRKRVRRKNAHHDEDVQKRHVRIMELLSKKRQPLNASEEEAVDIELLTLLKAILTEEGPDTFYQQWHDELIRQYEDKPGSAN